MNISFKGKQTRKSAFTLAEVLITLGIIGVVAALTLPTLIQTNKNKEVENKLQKIYSVMKQAILMSELDNGPREYWDSQCKGSEDDTSGEISCQVWYKKYILPYVKTIKIEEFNNFAGYNIAMYFEDGSVLISKKGYDYFFYPNAKNFTQSDLGSMDENGNLAERKGNGITYFSFSFSNVHCRNKADQRYCKPEFEPYKFALAEMTEEALTSGQYGCRKDGKIKAYCTALIQYNNWKIPKNYPFKVK